VYDGDRLLLEYDNAGNLLRRYAHGAGVDEPLVWYDGSTGGERRWLSVDRQGSVIATSGSLGQQTGTYAYGPYGEPANDNWTGSRFRYTGQIALPEVRLYHYKARVYDPILGRFLQTDPVLYADQMNLYAYVGNDPLNNSDPTGRQLVRDVYDRQRDQRTLNDGVNANGLPSGTETGRDESIQPQDAVGAVGDFVQNYNDMREANTIGADAYFHCRANCEASARGPAGEAVAGVISDTREMVDQATGDPASASAADQRANEQGRSAPTQPGFQGCEAACSSLRPPALSREYGHPPPPPPPDDQRTRPGGRYH
ncbi:MAG: hypothetical protein KGS44_16395, partial [Alphaproteobacteria bacterium]|nr:hypothetical protein [Alphaproteobacteria bacterium]